MRCGCPQCGAYMIQAESLALGCVCPACLYRCRACMGTDSVVSREELKKLILIDPEGERENPEETDMHPQSGPLTPEDFID